MIRAKVTVNTSNFDRKILAHKEGAQKSTVTALNRTAQYAQGKEQEATREVFSGPTPYTQNAFYTVRATTSNPSAKVGVKNQTGGRLSPDHWLFAQVMGGSRTQKAFERQLSSLGYLSGNAAAVPTHNAALDAYGNVSGGMIRSMLSQLQAQGRVTPGKRRRRAPSTLYFGIPMGQQSGNLGPGIYQRTGRGIKQVMAFISNLPRYSKRLDFYGVGKRAAEERFELEHRLAMRGVINAR